MRPSEPSQLPTGGSDRQAADGAPEPGGASAIHRPREPGKLSDSEESEESRQGEPEAHAEAIRRKRDRLWVSRHSPPEAEARDAHEESMPQRSSVARVVAWRRIILRA